MTGDGCAFPACEHPAEADALMCVEHARVKLAASGSWVGDKHDATSGGEH